ncbi:response regulator transcription factor [Ramlibacter aurantiacus]|uniref:helix-turn-helix transcriptional regulator n=1 Tax=Ramlibacter aurantiacus TaxID=2801330 RepID=UPI003F490D40
MKHLTRHDYACALDLLAALERQALDGRTFLPAAVDAVLSFVPAQACLADIDASSAEEGPRVAHVSLARCTGGSTLSIRLRRPQGCFSPRDRERLALLQPHLASLYRLAGGLAAGLSRAGPASRQLAPLATYPPLTPRERDVMQWLACGKTDADIAALLVISPRTVHKHLEHIYDKLGVETRTAAVMAVQRREDRQR